VEERRDSVGNRPDQRSDPGAALEFPERHDGLRGKLIFSAEDEALGFEPWITDGTAAGAFLLKDINPGNRNSFPSEFTLFGGRMFFTADDGVHGRELW